MVQLDYDQILHPKTEVFYEGSSLRKLRKFEEIATYLVNIAVQFEEISDHQELQCPF